MALSLFRLIAAVARTDVVGNTVGVFTSLVMIVLGGFIVSKDDTNPLVSWGFYASPMMYAQNALVLNEFLDKRWSDTNIYPQINASTVGEALLKSRGFFTKEYWFYLSIGVLIWFSCLFNMLFIAALTFLNPITDTEPSIKEEVDVKSSFSERRGMVLPFQPLPLAFNHVSYFIHFVLAGAVVATFCWYYTISGHLAKLPHKIKKGCIC